MRCLRCFCRGRIAPRMMMRDCLLQERVAPTRCLFRWRVASMRCPLHQRRGRGDAGRMSRGFHRERILGPMRRRCLQQGRIAPPMRRSLHRGRGAGGPMRCFCRGRIAPRMMCDCLLRERVAPTRCLLRWRVASMRCPLHHLGRGDAGRMSRCFLCLRCHLTRN